MFAICLACMAFGFIPSLVSSAPLFEDNFDAGGGVLDPAKWTTTAGGGFVFDEPPGSGSGDYALVLTGSTMTGGFHSVPTFTRGNNLRCTFRLWKEDAAWSYNSVAGPWCNDNSMTGTYPIYEHIEAGIGRETGGGAVRWCEGTTDWTTYAACPMLRDEFRTAWGTAISKETSLLVRIWLGDSTGCMAEYSQDDGTAWLPLQVGAGPIDTRGLNAGDPWNGARVSSTSPLWIFFGGVFGQTWIDDVIVENDDNLVPAELSMFVLE